MNRAEELISKLDFSDDMWRGLLRELVIYLKPKQIVECGGDEGWSAKFIIEAMPPDCKFYSIDIRDDYHVLTDTTRLNKIIGDDLDSASFKSFDPTKTDIWEIDSDHSLEHVRLQWKMYRPWMKRGVVVAVDDLDQHDVEVWFKEIKEEKWDNGRVGIIII